MQVRFGVLGPVVAWDGTGAPLDVKGPRHRALLGRLVVARRRVVPVSRLVDDLWADPPAGALSAVRTFVAALRRALEPQRPPREPARLLVTEGPGYALRAAPDAVDACRFEAAVGGLVLGACRGSDPGGGRVLVWVQDSAQQRTVGLPPLLVHHPDEAFGLCGFDCPAGGAEQAAARRPRLLPALPRPKSPQWRSPQAARLKIRCAHLPRRARPR